ncbi:hatching enzyme 1.2 [Genypterus blacodes]|uniref:hatching enzyme 1.2 n=1 Tax=Genypterus blacodes TaxID=154954 RepID=UPI003F775EDE
MERIILVCMVSTCLLAVDAQVTLRDWGPRDYKEREERDDGTAMDEIIKANEFQATRIIDGTTSLREGDIAVSAGRRGKVCFARSCLWSKSVDGHVYVAYRLSPEYTDMEEKMIKKGMENMEKGTCVRFVPRTHQRDYVDIQPKSGCWSYLGSRGGRQTVSLQAPNCIRVGIIAHEFMHALGFVHEQSRFDRDNYVTVMWPNIWRDRFRNFEKFKTDSLDLPYDYSSIMHFGMYAYSQDGKPTIIPKNSKDIKLGQASTLSHIDKMKINKMYQCGERDY